MQSQNNIQEQSEAARDTICIGPDAIRRIKLSFRNTCSIVDICDTVESLSLPLGNDDECCARYSLMELLNNAVRASAETNAAQPPCLELCCDSDQLNFRVSDQAGGFDPKRLPYDFYAVKDEIDLEDEAFDEYRTTHNDMRFGIGLVMARRAMPNFRLFFVDANGDETVWKDDGSVLGTVITFSIKLREQAND